MVVVGRFGRAYGVRGWLKLQSFTEPEANIFNYSDWRIHHARAGWQRVPWVEWRRVGSALTVKIDGVDAREGNLHLRGVDIAIERELLPELAEDEYYLCDLPGCEVLDSASEERLGIVKQLQRNKPQDLLTVQRADGSSCLLPLLPDVVIAEVDIGTRRIWVHREATLL